MALRGSKPTAVEKRLKALFYGPAGSGKTTAAIQFPKPYLIDTERGAENEQYVKLLNDSGGAYFFTTDPDELIAELTSLLSEKHEFRTVVIDPLTVIYNNLIDKGMETEGVEFGRYKVPADRKIKHILNLLLRLDMNVIITSHAKPNWVRAKDAKGKDTAVQEGMTFDCYGRLDYLFDLVVEVGKRGTSRVGTIRKTRMETFPEGEVIPFNYEEIAKRYGAKVLEKAAESVALATPEQAAQLRELLGERTDGAKLLEKWLDKAQAESIEEMPAEDVAKCIGFLLKKGAA